jgi:LacI family transcriptional regulator
MDQPKERRITLADIGGRLGISKNAVSLALSGKPGVSQNTRLAVKRVAAELGYLPPNRHEEGRPLRVALVAEASIFHRPATLFFGPLLHALQQALLKRHCSLTIFSLKSDEMEPLPLWLAREGFDGLFGLSKLPTEYLLALASIGPLTLIDHYDPAVACDQVLTENEAGAYAITRHLLDLGHRRLGFLGNLAHAPSYQERYQGFIRAVHAFGPSATSAAEWQWTEAKENSFDILTFYQQLDSKPSAWVCANDLLALSLMDVLQERGVAIPDEVAIAGFDDLDVGIPISRSLTTMHVDVQRYAEMAVDTLARRMHDPIVPYQTMRLVPRLVVRESTECVGLNDADRERNSLSRA